MPSTGWWNKGYIRKIYLGICDGVMAVEDIEKCDEGRTTQPLRIAMFGDGDIIGTTKKNHVKSRLLAA